jgi:hypothetical protein
MECQSFEIRLFLIEVSTWYTLPLLNMGHNDHTSQKMRCPSISPKNAWASVIY